MSKRARKKLDAERRTLWQFDPVTKVVKSKKVYDRKKQSRNRDVYDAGTVCLSLNKQQLPDPGPGPYGRSKRMDPGMNIFVLPGIKTGAVCKDGSDPYFFSFSAVINTVAYIR